MIDFRFFQQLDLLTANEAAKITGGKIVIEKSTHPEKALGEIEIKCFASVKGDRPAGACIFCTDKSKLAMALEKPFAVCLVETKLDNSLPDNLSEGCFIEVASAQLAFAQLANRLYAEKDSLDTKFKKSADFEGVMCGNNTDIASDVIIGPGTFIGPDVEIGSGSKVGMNVVIGPGVCIGKNCNIGSNSTIIHAIIEDRVQISTGARIGLAGFGFATENGNKIRMPQLGRVVIKNDVEIGGNTTIDRGTLEDTFIGRNTKIDNQVQIAHNVVLGKNCVLAAHTGISGSCIVGDNVMFGGKAGLADHLTIGDGAKIAANAGCMRDIPAGEMWAGSPAQPIRQFMREVVAISKLTENKKRKK